MATSSLNILFILYQPLLARFSWRIVKGAYPAKMRARTLPYACTPERASKCESFCVWTVRKAACIHWLFEKPFWAQATGIGVDSARFTGTKEVRAWRSFFFVMAGNPDAPRDTPVVTCYASSSANAPEHYQQAAFELGVAIAKRGWSQRNGGGRFGLMGKLTEGALSVGGRVDAVILDIFRVHNCHPELPSVRTVTNMAERKRGLYLDSDAFVALPGGLGTLEELAEVLSWRQLGFHNKPIVLFDVDGYWEPIVEWMRAAASLKMINAHFLHHGGVRCESTAEGVCDAIEQAWRAPAPSLEDAPSRCKIADRMTAGTRDKLDTDGTAIDAAADWTWTATYPSVDPARSRRAIG